MTLAILFSLLGSVGAMAGAALLLAFPDAMRQRLVEQLDGQWNALASAPAHAHTQPCSVVAASSTPLLLNAENSNTPMSASSVKASPSLAIT